MHPIDRLAARVDSLIQRAESGERIDWKKECQISDLDVAAAGVFFAKDAIDRTNAEDAAHNDRQIAADEVIRA